MASPASVEEFLDLIHKSGVTEGKRLDSYVQKLRANGSMPTEPSKLAGLMVRDGLLTHFQAEHLMQGKWRRFTIGKYKVLERLGSGGMGTVFLCEHKLMRCMRAIKILPAAKAKDEAALSRFYREARAVAAIDHPNIVHAYDIDQDESLHFLVMEYVDGSSLQDIVKKSGPLSVLRACHYIRQSAIGLDHAYRAKLVHRDIKPGNILVARDGAVKILDMGLARFFTDEEDVLTRKFDENVLGTADYLAPEQAIDSHTVDIRADIYGLGATFFYLLTGKTPFGEGTVAQKLMWHQSRQPKPVRDLRADVPAGVEAIITKMMAKNPDQRYATPAELAEALAPFTDTPIGPPPESEMPRLSPAATGRVATDGAGDAAEATSISRPETPRGLQKSSGGLGVTTGPAPATPTPARSGSIAAGSGPRVGGPVKTTPSVSAPITPTPAVNSAIATQAPASRAPVPAEEEEFAWQGLATDTADMAAAGADTPPTKGRPSTRPLAQGEQKAQSREKGINLLVIGLMVGAALIVVLVGGAIYGGYLIYSHFVGTEINGPPERPRLIVSRKEAEAGTKNCYKSIQAALHVAQPGDVIELAEDIEENLVWNFTPRITTEVTIQPAPGKEIAWRSRGKNPADSLLRLTGAKFFKVKGPGLTLDGDIGDKGKLKDLVFLLGRCQGLLIEDVQFRNFGRSAVCVFSAEGDLEHPIQLKGLTALTAAAEKDGAMFYIDAKPDFNVKQVDYLTISDCQAQAGQLVRAENGALGDKLVRIPGLK
jgi:serine/threonine protein kinase